MKRTLSLLTLFLVSFFALATTTVPNNSENDENSIYQFANGTNPTLETSRAVRSPSEYDGLGVSGAANKFCGNWFDTTFPPTPHYSIEEKNIVMGDVYMINDDLGLGTQKATCQIKRNYTNPETGYVTEGNLQSISITFTFEDRELPKCPPDPQNGQPLGPQTFLTYIGESPHCFDPQVLRDIDSCGDDFSAGQEIYPAFDNTAPRVCKIKDDGSWCGYIKSGDVYTPDFENSGCYDHVSPDYDDSVTPDIDTSDPECQDIGNGVSACIEDPSNVCDADGCQTGCGVVNGTFVCLAGDEDHDGIPDYADRDRNGDNIADIDDLNMPEYPEDKKVSVDVSGVETRIDKTNLKLTDIKNSLDALKSQGSTSSSELSDIKEALTTGTFTGPNPDDFDNTMVDTAFNSLTDNLGKSETDMGGRSFVPDDAQFIETFIGNLPAANCVNPVIHDQQLDFCSRAETINGALYWIVAALTLIGIFHELNSSLRRHS